MKTIYWNHTPIKRGGIQSLDVTFVAKTGHGTFRVTLHWDRYIARQSGGEIAVLDGANFRTVLLLHHHDMGLFAAFDEKPAPTQGEFERAGKLPGLLREQADDLVKLGSDIIGQAENRP